MSAPDKHYVVSTPAGDIRFETFAEMAVAYGDRLAAGRHYYMHVSNSDRADLDYGGLNDAERDIIEMIENNRSWFGGRRDALGAE